MLLTAIKIHNTCPEREASIEHPPAAKEVLPPPLRPLRLRVNNPNRVLSRMLRQYSILFLLPVAAGSGQESTSPESPAETSQPIFVACVTRCMSPIVIAKRSAVAIPSGIHPWPGGGPYPRGRGGLPQRCALRNDGGGVWPQAPIMPSPFLRESPPTAVGCSQWPGGVWLEAAITPSPFLRESSPTTNDCQNVYGKRPAVADVVESVYRNVEVDCAPMVC